MFLVTENARRGESALRTLLTSLPVTHGPLHLIDLGGHQLAWSRVQANENLHHYDDGVLLGKLAVDEAPMDDPIRHRGPLPSSFAALLPGVVIRSGPPRTVEPIGTTNVFHCGTSVSDRQLLLAAHDDLQPSPIRVAILSTVGYFPGNLTMFAEIERVPFLHRWAPLTRTAARIRELTLPRPDDDALVDRLVSNVPKDVPAPIGLSGGYDSRFVFGVLRRATPQARILRFTDPETDIVQTIAREVGVEVVTAGGLTDQDHRHEPGAFTLMTDAMIWCGSHQSNRLRRFLGPTDAYHSGHFADSIIKNAFKTAWKVPRPDRPYWPHLVATAVTPRARTTPVLRSSNTREEIVDDVLGALAYQRDYADFRSRKQWANWVYFMNRGLRWAQASYGDLTFYANPLHVLSDLDAQLLGIVTSGWSNFSNDRARLMTHRLLPEVTVGYHNGQSVVPNDGLRRAIDKVEYEYVERVRTRRKALARLASRKPHFADDAAVDPPGWDRLYNEPSSVAAASGPYGVGHAAVTVSHVLAFLAAARRAHTETPPPTAPEPRSAPREVE
jgi:hypothetical protein